jgi:hypothetical protein
MIVAVGVARKDPEMRALDGVDEDGNGVDALPDPGREDCVLNEALRAACSCPSQEYGGLQLGDDTAC